MQLMATAAILGVMGLVRVASAQLVRRLRGNPDSGRRAIVIVRNLTLLLALVGLALVWSDQLRMVGVSLLAFVLAFVIAAQDVIRSVMGTMTRATSNSFSIGDLVVVGGQRGYVIDSSATATTLLEIGPGHLRTGRTVTIPNSSFLTEPVINETGGHRFILHSFTVPVALERWRFASDVLLDAARAETFPYVEPARTHMEARARRHSLPMPIVEPLVFATPADTETVTLTVRVPVEAQDLWRVEKAISEAWLDASATDWALQDPEPPAQSSANTGNRRRDDLSAGQHIP